MKKVSFYSFFLIFLCINAFAIRIDPEDFSNNSISIDFEDVEENDPNSGNGALTPILDYQSLGVIFHVHNQEDFVGTIHDVFRLGGWVTGQGLSIATNVGDDSSIELAFTYPVFQVGALIAVSNANLKVYDCENNLLEEADTKNVLYSNDPSLRVTEFIGIESQGICKALFTDISSNGLILSIDNVTFALSDLITIDDVIDFILDHEDIEGVGNGKSDNNRYNAFLNMLNSAADLIEAGDTEGACNLLNSIVKKCDGEGRPPDFITGDPETMEELKGRLNALIESICGE